MLKPSRLLRGLLFLLLAALIAVGVSLSKPIWFAALIEKELSRHGVDVEIQHLSAGFSSQAYHLDARFKAKMPQYGINIKQAYGQVAFSWLNWFKGQPVITRLNVGETDLILDRQQLIKQLEKQKKAPPTAKHNSRRFIPQQWQIEQANVQIEGQNLHLNGDGDGLKQAALTIKDQGEGILYLRYHQQQQILTLAGKQINLKPFTGQAATLQQLQAAIDTQDWLKSRAETHLEYRGMNSHIQLTGQKSQLLIQAQSNDQQIAVVAQPIDKNQGINLMFNHVDLSIFQTLQPLLPAKHEWPALAGFIDGTITLYRNQGIKLALLTLDNVGVSHSTGQVNQVSGDITYRDGLVNYQLQLAQSQVALPAVFPRGVAALSGDMQGTFDTQAQVLTFNKLTLNSQDFEQLTAAGSIDFGQQSIDISATAKNVNVAKRKHFLPPQLPKNTRNWLANALLSGKKNHSELTMKGQLEDFFEQPDSVFLLKTDLQATEFQYLVDNPTVFIQKGQLIIDKRQLKVAISKGSVKGIAIEGSASIADLLRAEVLVNVGFKQQAVEKLLPIAQKSIAKDSILAVNRLLSIQGKVSMNLAIQLPLWENSPDETFDIELLSDGLAAQLKLYPLLPITQAKTRVLINEQGLQQVTLQGRQEKQPIKINIHRDQAKNYRTHVDVNADALDLLSKLKLITVEQKQLIGNYRLINGRSPYEAVIIIDKNGDFQSVKLTSSLQGTALNLFSLLQKGRQTHLPLQLRYTAKNRRLEVNLQKRMDLTLAVDNNGQLEGLMLDNRNRKKAYQAGLLQFYWHTKRFNFSRLDNFRLAWAELSKTQSKHKPYRYQFDVAIDAMQVSDDKPASPLTIRGNLAQLNVVSPFANGQVNYQKNKLLANFSLLDVSRWLDFVSKTEINPEGREVTSIDLAKTLPQMQITIDRLLYEGNNVGSANIRTSIQDGRYSIDQLFVRGKNYFFEASGYEAKEPQGIATHIQADFKGEDIDKIIQLFKLNPILDGKFIDLSATLSWPGKAHELNLRKSYGSMKVNAQNVKLTQVSSGVGGVIGLMDIAGILRRISLDFQNLSSSKIAFDVVKGNWNIGGGRAMTRDAYATGSLIDLKIVGGADLHRRLFDNIKVTVIPKASNVIPVVGAVAGGVVGAVIGVVVQQVVGGVMNEAVGLPYVLSGSWVKPVLTAADDVGKKPKKPAKKPPNIILESLQ